MVWTLLKVVKKQAGSADPQSDVLQAAKDISSILASEHNKKKKVLHPNEMAALALTLNPDLAMAASHKLASGGVSSTAALISASGLPPLH